MRMEVEWLVILPQMGSHWKAGWLQFPVVRQVRLAAVAFGGIL